MRRSSSGVQPRLNGGRHPCPCSYVFLTDGWVAQALEMLITTKRHHPSKWAPHHSESYFLRLSTVCCRCLNFLAGKHGGAVCMSHDSLCCLRRTTTAIHETLNSYYAILFYPIFLYVLFFCLILDIVILFSISKIWRF